MSSTLARASLFVTMITIYFLFLMSMFSYFEMASSSTETVIKPPSCNVRKAAAPSSISIPSMPNTAQRPMKSPTVISYHPVLLNELNDNSEDNYQYPILFDDNSTIKVVPSARSVISPEPVVMRNGDVLRKLGGWIWGVVTRGRKELLRTPRRRSSLIRVHAKE